jgi:hypothetical protein
VTTNVEDTQPTLIEKAPTALDLLDQYEALSRSERIEFTELALGRKSLEHIHHDFALLRLQLTEDTHS